METVIVICLLIVIFLLAKDKIVIKKHHKHQPNQEKVNSSLPDIMGQSKLQRSLSVPKESYDGQVQKEDRFNDNFDIEIDEVKVELQIPQEELDEVFGNVPDFENEEEEWNSYGIFNGDNGFAQGVTFEELSTVKTLLKKEKMIPSQKETATVLLQKIQGTELFDLLENSIEDASQKIAKLLDGTVFSETDSGFSFLHKNNLEDFDIGEFV
ncbi:conjugal transfer protein TraD [Flavobacterium muglaense]|uniref:Conjugal transfer protein TraD n=1 Tax=Flavobacterium muglaense TaxID=2764716 RepID=A0A923N0H3_9FLAO|nr:conjugal transfer protein TraD [Flavobacterium muglaense]MBC5837843.1 conjugal transfer protein TraD [Flavobacterium muglaense]MBC5844399.1 conjugal transfer protein TraD [Flavobacterium muglaense]